MEVIRCLAQPGLGLVLLRLALGLGRGEQMLLPHIPQGRGLCCAHRHKSLQELGRNGGRGLHCT